MLIVRAMCTLIIVCLKIVMSVLVTHVRMVEHALMELQAIVATVHCSTLATTVNKDSGATQTRVRMEVCVLKQLTPSCATVQSSILETLVNRGGDASLIHANTEACVVRNFQGLTAAVH